STSNCSRRNSAYMLRESTWSSTSNTVVRLDGGGESVIPCVTAAWHRRSSWSRNQVADGRFEVLGRTRLFEHGVAACPLRPARVGGEGGVARHRQHGNRGRSRILFQPAGQLVPVDPRDVEVGHHDIRNRFER